MGDLNFFRKYIAITFFIRKEVRAMPSDKMLIGQYAHNIDEKSRLIMPQKLREALGEEFIVTLGIDGCLFVMSVEEWTSFKERMRNQPMAKARDVQRYFFGNATLVQPDKQGRILIAAHLKQAAALSKEVVIVGADNRVELWSAERWAQWTAAKEDFMGENIAALMEDIGV